jgi:indolepyruvate ferredoxin oxidoreductase alpha subunit
MHSSQNEQDNRNYAKFAKLPLLEPADSQEAKDFTELAFELSERFDTPVMLRTTTRISHSQSIVQLGERVSLDAPQAVRRDIAKYVMLPSHAKTRHAFVEQRLRDLAAAAESLLVNRIEEGDASVGIVASGAAYMYAREAFPQASFLKLGMSHPLPRGLIEQFRASVEKLYVVEELDPFLEEAIRLCGVRVDGGKEALGLLGELDPGRIARGLSAIGAAGAVADLVGASPAAMEDLPGRPPTLCPGCSHRGVFIALRKLKLFVSGDIGCYTLGALEPFGAMHAVVCMGASIGMAHGMEKVVAKDGKLKNRAVAVIGDSTLFHSGLTPLLDIAWNRGSAVTLILDNRTTAMTGGQQNPGTGRSLAGQESPPIDLPRLCEALGIGLVMTVDPGDVAAVERALRDALAAEQPAVIIAQAPCALQYRIKSEAWHVDPELCTGCKVCLKAGCVGLSLIEEDETKRVEIIPSQCNGCGVCAQLCKQGAIQAPVTEEVTA